MKRWEKPVLILDSISDLATVKGILESAGSAEKLYYNSLSSEILAEFNQSVIPCEHRHCLVELVDDLNREEGYEPVALQVTKTSRLLSDIEVSLPKKISLILGEKDISQSLLDRSIQLHLPILGTALTLSAGIAAGIFLYAAHLHQEQRVYMYL